MKKHLKTILLMSVTGLCFVQDGRSSSLLLQVQDEQKEKSSQNTTQHFSSLNLSEVKNEEDKNQILKPKDISRLTLDDVVRLVNNWVFIYDKDDHYKEGGKYLDVLKTIGNIDQTDFSKDCITFICSELGSYYTREGRSNLATAAFTLQKHHEGN